jgi:hypothetical protein
MWMKEMLMHFLYKYRERKIYKKVQHRLHVTKYSLIHYSNKKNFIQTISNHINLLYQPSSFLLTNRCYFPRVYVFFSF